MKLLSIALITFFGICLNFSGVAQSKTGSKTSTAKFVVKVVTKDDVPKSSISFSAAGKKTFIKKISGDAKEIEKSEYARMKIPTTAVGAVGAWYAGAGDYYYAVPSAKGYTIYEGYDEEMQKTPGFHWKKMKEMVGK